MDREEAAELYKAVKAKNIKDLKDKLAVLEAGTEDSKQVDILFQSFDKNKDGKVSKEEFIKCVTSTGFDIDVMSLASESVQEPSAKRQKLDSKGHFKVGDKAKVFGLTSAAG